MYVHGPTRKKCVLSMPRSKKSIESKLLQIVLGGNPTRTPKGKAMRAGIVKRTDAARSAAGIVADADGGRRGYPGAKVAVFRRIISEMPEHDTYIAGFAGHDAVFFHKRPAPSSIVIDADGDVVSWWRSRPLPATATILQDDFLVWIQTREGRAVSRDPRTLIYIDPPYLRGVRCAKKLYGVHDMDSFEDHADLLELVRPLGCMVMISGYNSTLYSRMIGHWRSISYAAMTRGGLRQEFLWMNFPAGLKLHDCRYVGGDYRKRQDLKRKIETWRRRFAAMPAWERQALREALDEVDAVDPTGGDAVGARDQEQSALPPMLPIGARCRSYNGSAAVAGQIQIDSGKTKGSEVEPT